MVYSRNLTFNFYGIEHDTVVCMVTNHLNPIKCQPCSPEDYDLVITNRDTFCEGLLAFVGIPTITNSGQTRPFDSTLVYPESVKDINFHQGLFLEDGIGHTWKNIIKEHDDLDEVIAALYH